MKPLDYSVLAAAVLKRKTEGTCRSGGLSRDSGIAVVAQAMHQSSRMRRRARRSALGAIAAAVALTLTTGVLIHRYVAPRAQVAHGCAVSDQNCAGVGRQAAAVDIGHLSNQRVLPGHVLKSGSTETVRVHFDSGTQLSLGTDTTLVYDEGTSVHRFSIARGSVHFKVAKLGRGERFLINTHDAQIEVRGTVFSTAVVDPASACGHQTVVTVEEGVVEVRSGTQDYLLRAGERWPATCTQQTQDDAPQQHAARAARSPRVGRRSAPPGPSNASSEQVAETATPVSPASTARAEQGPAETQNASALTLQNNLYAHACSEARLGHTRQALALLNQLISRFPDSALLESAYAQRLRLLRQTGSGQARDEAERYLQRFPSGFARTEARDVLGSP